MSESGDFDPGPWRGHDYGSLRKAFDIHVGRSYTEAVKTGKSVNDLLPDSLSTDSAAPLIILCDVTGSMGEWPKIIFEKLPYFEVEGQEYLGKDLEISFGAIGDAYTDTYPLQARPFTKGLDLEKRMLELTIEKGGGSQMQETYELAALYCARRVSMPKAIRPILIFIGDEAPYDFVDAAHAKRYCKETLKGRLTTKEIFRELQTKYSVYLIRKPYEQTRDNTVSQNDQCIRHKWAELLGDDRIANLPEAGRVVDVMFGLFAQETGRVEYFYKEMKERQTPAQVETVYKSLVSIHKLSGDNPSSLSASRGHSMMHRDDDGIASKPLM